jgi:hypothetical protein
LPGPTGSGKSTLVAELLRHGASYFSDEHAFIDARLLERLQEREHAVEGPLVLDPGGKVSLLERRTPFDLGAAGAEIVVHEREQ